MSTTEIKVNDPVHLHCNRSNTTLPGIVREVFERQARVEVARKKGNRWMFESRDVKVSDLAHRAGSIGAVNLTDFQLC